MFLEALTGAYSYLDINAHIHTKQRHGMERGHDNTEEADLRLSSNIQPAACTTNAPFRSGLLGNARESGSETLVGARDSHCASAPVSPLHCRTRSEVRLLGRPGSAALHAQPPAHGTGERPTGSAAQRITRERDG